MDRPQQTNSLHLPPDDSRDELNMEKQAYANGPIDDQHREPFDGGEGIEFSNRCWQQSSTPCGPGAEVTQRLDAGG
jgi:hypothetical protein